MANGEIKIERPNRGPAMVVYEDRIPFYLVYIGAHPYDNRLTHKLRVHLRELTAEEPMDKLESPVKTNRHSMRKGLAAVENSPA